MQARVPMVRKDIVAWLETYSLWKVVDVYNVVEAMEGEGSDNG